MYNNIYNNNNIIMMIVKHINASINTHTHTPLYHYTYLCISIYIYGSIYDLIHILDGEIRPWPWGHGASCAKSSARDCGSKAMAKSPWKSFISAIAIGKKTRWSVNSHGKWTIFGFLGPDLTWWWINMMIFNMMDLTCFFWNLTM